MIFHVYFNPLYCLMYNKIEFITQNRSRDRFEGNMMWCLKSIDIDRVKCCLNETVSYHKVCCSVLVELHSTVVVNYYYDGSHVRVQIQDITRYHVILPPLIHPHPLSVIGVNSSCPICWSIDRVKFKKIINDEAILI